MKQLNGLEWTFDTVVSTYEKMRPGYVDALYQSIFDYIPIHQKNNVLEIGIGSGQATLPILQTGCNFTAVEYGEHFSELCRKKFQEYSNFSIITDKFENITNGTYDLVFSATAFHWIPEDIGYPKVYSLLKKGGAFAQFANHPYLDKENPSLTEEIEQIYDEYYYRYYDKNQKPVQEYCEERARQKSMIAKKYGFEDLRYSLFHRTRTFSAKEYIMLLNTYSDHIAIEKPVRTKFFSEIEMAINTQGGTITLYDTIDLQLARKQ